MKMLFEPNLYLVYEDTQSGVENFLGIDLRMGRVTSPRNSFGTFQLLFFNLETTQSSKAGTVLQWSLRITGEEMKWGSDQVICIFL